jgi:hypothetical protein
MLIVVLLLQCQVRFFGSGKDTGQGDMNRLAACIKAGSIDEVYMITRWNGHITTKTVNALCKTHKIPVRILPQTERVRLKGMATATGSESD